MGIRPSELEERLERNERSFVLDIRPREAYQTGAIDSSYNIPCYDSLRRGDDTPLRKRLDELPTDAEIVVVCKQGIVAKRATQLLTAEGYDAVTLAGGMGGWQGYKNGTVGYKIRKLLWRIF